MEDVDQPPSVRETIAKLRESLQSIAEQCKLFSPRDEGLFHSLGKINVEEAKYDFTQATDYIRTVCTSWEACHPQTLQQLPKYQKNLKQRQELTHSMNTICNDLQKCCQMGEQHLLLNKQPSSFNENPVNFLTQFVEWMKSVSKKAGAKCLVNMEENGQITDDNNEILLYADKFVVEIKLEKDGVSSVSISRDGDTAIECDRLCELLRKRHIEEFTEVLKWIAKMESLLSQAKLPMSVLTTLESDLKEACKIEMEEHDEEWALLRGHGIVERQAVALQITFYGSPFYLLHSEEERKQIRSTYRWLREYSGEQNPLGGEGKFSSLCSICRAFVTLQRTAWDEKLPITSQLLSAEQRAEKPGELWKDSKSVNSETEEHPQVCYSLELYPPIPMNVHFDLLSKVSLATSSGYTRTIAPVQASLLSLLTKENEMQQNGDERQYSVVVGGSEMQFVFTGEITRAIQLCHVPMVHPSHVLRILNPLRQHIVFNELLTSCTKCTALSANTNTRTVFEVNFEAPFLIRFLFLREEFVSLDVNVACGGDISAVLGSSLEPHSAYLTSLLQRSHHIPLSLQKLFDKL